MATSKKHEYSFKAQSIAAYCQALSHPARQLILEQLQNQGPLCVQVIAKNHPLSKESLSGHLRILRATQLVDCEEKYPYTFYDLHGENLAQAQRELMAFFQLFSPGK